MNFISKWLKRMKIENELDRLFRDYIGYVNITLDRAEHLDNGMVKLPVDSAIIKHITEKVKKLKKELEQYK